MPLLKEEKSDRELQLQEDWFAVRRFVKTNFEKRPDINAILFLIGMNELGIVKETWEKEEKQDLMHIAICALFEADGHYKKTHTDEDGWPHYEHVQGLPALHLKKQEGLLKEKIIDYFRAKEYI